MHHAPAGQAACERPGDMIHRACVLGSLTTCSSIVDPDAHLSLSAHRSSSSPGEVSSPAAGRRTRRQGVGFTIGMHARNSSSSVPLCEGRHEGEIHAAEWACNGVKSIGTSARGDALISFCRCCCQLTVISFV